MVNEELFLKLGYKLKFEVFCPLGLSGESIREVKRNKTDQKTATCVLLGGINQE